MSNEKGFANTDNKKRESLRIKAEKMEKRAKKIAIKITTILFLTLFKNFIVILIHTILVQNMVILST